MTENLKKVLLSSNHIDKFNDYVDNIYVAFDNTNKYENSELNHICRVQALCPSYP